MKKSPKTKVSQVSRLAVISFVLLALSKVAISQPSVSIKKEWSLKDEFTMPESASFDPQGQQIFVSNVNVYAKDGNGFVSRVSADGTEVDHTWLSGLNSPTGLSVHEGLLYVVDYDQLLIVDIENRKIISRATTPHKKPALNDVAVSKSGTVFVTGSASSSIYILQDAHLKIWKQDNDLLKHANGLLVENTKLLFGGVNWLVFDVQSQQIDTSSPTVTPTITEIDGISTDGCDGYFITLIDDDRIWHINAAGNAQAVSDELVKGIDLNYFGGKLYVPTVGGGLSVFSIAASCD